MAYSMDLREKVLAACDRGESVASVARRFEISEPTIRSFKRLRREQGRPTPRRTGPKGPIKLTPADHQALRAAVAQRPGATLLELRGVLHVEVAESTVCRTLKKLGLSLKKSRSSPPSSVGPRWRSGVAALPSPDGSSSPSVSSSSTRAGPGRT